MTAAGNETVLADIVRLTEAAEQRKSAYVVLADRVSRFYAPFVHSLALLAFLGWILLGGLAWQPALLIAIAVLIVTCPCALGLAVPVVQVVATGRLLRRGVLVKSGDALERLAAADTVVFRQDRHPDPGYAGADRPRRGPGPMPWRWPPRSPRQAAIRCRAPLLRRRRELRRRQMLRNRRAAALAWRRPLGKSGSARRTGAA